MPDAAPLSAFLTDEWARFTKGIKQLDPDTWRALEQARGVQATNPNGTKQINVPGWDDIIHVAPRYEPTAAERSEYYAARRERRAPSLSPQALAAIDANRAQVERIRNSAQPEWAQAWGSIMTAIDNVQDMLSTLSTFGRLALWGAEKWGPLSQALALESQLVALAGETTADVARRRGLIMAGRAALPLAARIGARAVPVLGWVILAADLLNLLNLAGMLASPAFGALCTGNPLQAAAGIPSMFLKQGLKNELWKRARTNPIGREARMAARLKAVGRWPSFFNMLEVLQTTDQLFGVGLSFGAVVGMLNEIGAAGTRAIEGKSTTVNVTDAASSWQRLIEGTYKSMSSGEQWLWSKSNAVMATTGAILRTQDTFTADEHIETLTAYHAASAHVFSILGKLPWEPVLEHMADVPIRPVVNPGELTRAWAEYAGLTIPDPGPWWLPGQPHVLTLNDYVEQTWRLNTTALHDFLRPRRNGYDGLYYGALASLTTENHIHFLTGTDQGVKYRLQPDWALVAGLAERGYLLNPSDGAEKLWPLWQDARRLHLELAPRTLELTHWRELAARHRCTLLKQLPADSKFPIEWQIHAD